jgi:predicted DNA-binding transcriptional regulator AlpA
MNLRDTAALRDFETLPSGAYVRVAVVAALFGVSPVTPWRWAERGILPAPEKIGPGTTGWQVGPLREARAKMAKPGARAADQRAPSALPPAPTIGRAGRPAAIQVISTAALLAELERRTAAPTQTAPTKLKQNPRAAAQPAPIAAAAR